MKTIVITASLAAISLAGAITLLAQAPAAQKLAAGTYDVYAPSPQVWRIRVDSKTMGNATITGHFNVTVGSPKTVDVFVFDEANYKKWTDEDEAARASAKPLISVMHSADGNIDAKLTESGYHYLVISDRREYQGMKTVVADIKLEYSQN